jgi:hypothetical protein
MCREDEKPCTAREAAGELRAKAPLLAAALARAEERPS